MNIKDFDPEEFDIDEELDIDPNALDVELLRQPTLFGFYGKLEAKAKKERDDTWEDLKVTRSRLIKEAWENPSVLPGGKANAQVVEAYYRDHKDHIAGKKAFNEAEYNLNLIGVAVAKVRERRYSMIEMVRQMGMEYFSGPDIPRNLGEEYQAYMENRSSKTRDKVKERMNNSRKRTRK